MLLASVDVYEHSITLTRHGAAGSRARSYISAAEAAALFVSPESRKAGWVKMGDGIYAWSQSGGLERWLVVRPAGPATIRLERGKTQERLRVMLPALVAQMESRRDTQGRRQWKTIGKVFAHLGRTLDDRTPLYACPLPNCYAAGNWCHGDVTVDRRDLDDAAALTVLERSFVSESVHTAHATTSPLTARGVKAYRNVIGLLKKCPKGPPAWALQPAGTMGQLMGGAR